MRRCRQPLGSGIDQNETRNSRRVVHGIRGDNEAAERVADKDILLARRDVLENRRELVHHPVEGPRAGRRIAPGEAGTIVRTGTCERRDTWLHDSPTERRRCNAGFEKNDRTAVACTHNVQAVAADIYQPARRRQAPALASSPDLLIQNAERQ